MTAPSPIHGGPLVELRPGLFREETGGGAILHGAPYTLSRIPAALGFQNRCERGRVYLHRGNVARLDGVLARIGGAHV